jgi:PTH1 family peptidyl-tRNA hydrolase
MTDDSAWLIAGLGNPGPGYARTRHNIGFQVLDRLAARHGMQFARGRAKSHVAEGRIGDRRVILVKPQTWMNLSGDAVQPLLHWYKLPPERLIVVYDDLDLPLGKLRIRERGSSGGHHGVDSIIGRLGTNAFPRVRIGVGRSPGREQVGHVLSRFRRDEEALMEEARDRAADATETLLAEGVAGAMNRFNG